jgi:hypothetical protein
MNNKHRIAIGYLLLVLWLGISSLPINTRNQINNQINQFFNDPEASGNRTRVLRQHSSKE